MRVIGTGNAVPRSGCPVINPRVDFGGGDWTSEAMTELTETTEARRV